VSILIKLLVFFSFIFAAVVERIIDVSYKILKAERVSVMILSRDKKKLIVAESKDALGMEISASGGIGGYVVSSGSLLNVKDAYNDPRFNPQVDIDREFKTKSILCAPVTINHEVVGVLYALNKEGPVVEFDKNDEMVIEYLASNAGVAIKKAQLYHQAIRAQRNSAAILSIVRARSSHGSVEKILTTTIEAAYDLLVPELVSVYLVDQLLHEAWICVSKDGLEGLTIPFGRGVAGTVAASGTTIRLENVYEDPRFCQDVDIQTGFKTKSMLCMGVPGFASNSKPIAVIQLINKLNGRGFDEDDEEALKMLCEEVSVALRQKVLELSLLRYSTYVRNRPDKIDDVRLEESLLKEYGSVTQRFKYSSSIRTRQLNRSVTSGVRAPQSISQDLLLQSQAIRATLGHFSVEEDCSYKDMYRWDLDPFATRDADLMVYAEQMFRDFGLINEFKIDIKKLQNLIMGAHALYHSDNAFHNFKHGFSVMHITYHILRSGPSSYLTSLDILAALVSALCHDLDHPGNNNAFEVATLSELALTHSNDSVLERHHSSMTHRLLHAPDSNIFESLSAQDRAEVLAIVTDTIMATDMAVHFYHVERLEMSSKSSPHFESNDPNSRRILLGHIVHAADLSGQVLSPELSRKWGEKCIQEFRNQCTKEKELNLPVTAFMDGLDDEVQRMRLQHGFVGNIVIPLWTALATCFPSLSHTTIQAQVNHDYYGQRIQFLSDVSQQQQK
jgi:dual 3',5'-cyclic-AMP and -GMP phosphodiesterase 11